MTFKPIDANDPEQVDAALVRAGMMPLGVFAMFLERGLTTLDMALYTALADRIIAARESDR